MKVKFIAEIDDVDLTKGKIYEVMAVEDRWYRIKDDSEDDYLYPPELFEIVMRDSAPKYNYLQA